MAKKKEEPKGMEDRFNTGETIYLDEYGNIIEKREEKEEIKIDEQEVQDATT